MALGDPINIEVTVSGETNSIVSFQGGETNVTRYSGGSDICTTLTRENSATVVESGYDVCVVLTGESATTVGAGHFTPFSCSDLDECNLFESGYVSGLGTIFVSGSGNYLLVSGASSAAAITIKDEGVNLTSAVSSIDFVGDGITATNSGPIVTITVNTGLLITDASNIGTGSGIYSGTIDNDLKLRSLVGSGNVYVTGAPNDDQHIYFGTILTGSIHGGETAKITCPEGFIKNPDGECVPKEEIGCPEGFIKDENGVCVPNPDPRPRPEPGISIFSGVSPSVEVGCPELFDPHDEKVTLLIQSDFEGAGVNDDLDTILLVQSSINNEGGETKLLVQSQEETCLLIQSETTDGSTTFDDSGPTDHAITANGATHSTAVTAKFGSSSMKFDGTNASPDYLSIPYHSDFDIDGEDYTVELWVKTDSNNDPSSDGKAEFISAFHPDSPFPGWLFGIGYTGSPGKLGFRMQRGGQSGVSNILATGNTRIDDNVWHHVVFVKKGETFQFYLDGNLDGSGTFSNWVSTNSNHTIYIGRDANTAPGRAFVGYMEEIRITKKALYTSNFTIPAAPFSVPSLTDFTDTTTNHTITRVGDTIHSNTKSKFGNTAMYFDGDGDYLSIPYHANLEWGTEDVTIEMWVNFNSLTNYDGLYGNDEGSGANPKIFLQVFDNTELRFGAHHIPGQTGNPMTTTSGLGLTTNKWYHVALVKNGNSVVLYVDGKIEGSFNFDTSDIKVNAPTTIGYIGEGASTQSLDGYLEEVRITKGIARYIKNFDPPTAPFSLDDSSEFSDSSKKNHDVTAVSNTTHSTVEKKFGDTSIKLDGTDDHLSIADHEDWNFGTKDFTMETWVYLLDNTAQAIFNQSQAGGAGDSAFVMYIGTGGNAGKIGIYLTNDNSTTWPGAGGAMNQTVLATSRWYHIAAERHGNKLTMYVDGVGATIVLPAGFAMENSSRALQIGIQDTSSDLNGYLDEIRISKIARYQKNFDVPDKPFTIEQQGGAGAKPFKPFEIKDSSNKKHTITRAGDAQHVIDNAKFGDTSIKFDGDGDYLSIVDDDSSWHFGNEDFTVELWAYFEDVTANSSLYRVLISQNQNISNGRGPNLYWHNNKLYWGWGTGVYGYNSDQFSRDWTPTINTWHHIAVTRKENVHTIWVDGNQLGATEIVGISYHNANTPMFIAGDNVNSNLFKGRLEEIRITKGVARYETNFNVPEAPFVIGALAGKYKKCIDGTYDENYDKTVLIILSNENNGSTTFTDSSSSKHTITSVGAIHDDEFKAYALAHPTDPPFGKSVIKFDGTDDYLSIPYHEDFDIGLKDYTIEAWIKTSDDLGEIVSAFNSADPFRGWLFGIGYAGHAGKLVFKGQGNGIREVVASNDRVDDGKWHHVAFSKDNYRYVFYIDGKPSGWGDLIEFIIEPSDQPIIIGAANNSTKNRHFNGYIDSLRITKEKSQGGARYGGEFSPPLLFATKSLPKPNSVDPQYLVFKNIVGEGNVSLTSDLEQVYISGAGMAATGVSNIGTGSGIYSGTLDDEIKLRSLVGSGDITVTGVDGDDEHIYISSKTCIVGTGNLVATGDTCTILEQLVTGFFGAMTATSGVSIVDPGGKCLPGFVKDANGECVPEGGKCPEGFVKNENGECVLAPPIPPKPPKPEPEPPKPEPPKPKPPTGPEGTNYACSPAIANKYNKNDESDVLLIQSELEKEFASLLIQSNVETGGDTVLLVQSEQGNNTTSFIDSSPKNHSVTAINGAKHSDTRGKFGKSSMFFDGTDDYLEVSDHNDFEFGTEDFTIEFWFYQSSLGTGNPVYFSKWESGSSTSSFICYYGTASGKIDFLVKDGTTTFSVSSTTSVVIDTWHHAAIVRNGTDLSIYLNGNKEASTTLSASYDITDSSYPVKIGAQNTTPINYFHGFMEEFRITKGRALYNASFAVPTGPFTEFVPTLLIQSEHANGSTSFADSSSKHNVNPSSNINHSTAVSKFGNSSIHFKGSDSKSDHNGYLSVPHSDDLDFGTGDFTVDMWIYPTRLDKGNMIYAVDQCGGSYPKMWLRISQNDATELEFAVAYISPNSGSTKYLYTSGASLAINNWYHISLERKSDTVRIYVNGTSKGSDSYTHSLNFSPESGCPESATTMFGGIGGGEYGINLKWNGYMEEIRLLKGIARYDGSNFTPPATESSYQNVMGYFVDSAGRHKITSYNGAAHSIAQKKFGNTAILFDGTNDYLTASYSDDFEIGDEDYTVEAWIKTSDTVGEIVSAHNSASPYKGWLFGIGYGTGNDGKLVFYNADASSSETVVSTSTVNNNNWRHVVFVKSGTTYTFYIDGTASGTGTLTKTSIGSGQDIIIGASNNATKARYFNGYMEDIRVTRSALYPGAFTAPTNFLVASDGYAKNTKIFTDSSDKEHVITQYNDTHHSLTKAKFGDSSMYFDGDDDYLDVLDKGNFDFVGDFTIEMWVKRNITNEVEYLFGWDGLDGYEDFTFRFQADGEFRLIWRDATMADTSGQVNLDTTDIATTDTNWHHFAVVRDGTTIKIYKDGVASANTLSVGTAAAYDYPENLNIGRVRWVHPSIAGWGRFNGYMEEFRITKGLARYIKEFKVPTGPNPTAAEVASYKKCQAALHDPLYKKSVLLIQSAEVHGSSTFVDSSIHNHAITAAGDAHHSNKQFKFQPTSMVFDGAGDYLSVADSSKFNLSNKEFTIEFWIRFDGTPDIGSSDTGIILMNLCENQSGRRNPSFMIYLGSGFGFSGGPHLVFHTNHDGAIQRNVYWPWDPSGDTWHFVRITRSGDKWVMAVSDPDSNETKPIEGVKELPEGSFSDELPDISAPLTIGMGVWEDVSSSDHKIYLKGNMEEIRWTTEQSQFGARSVGTIPTPATPFPARQVPALLHSVEPQVLNLRNFIGTGNTTVTADDEYIYISGTSTVTGASNIGIGSGIYSGTLDDEIKLRSISGLGTITVSGDDQHIIISGAASSASMSVKDEGSEITSTVSSFDFVGDGITATNVGPAVTVAVNTGSLYPASNPSGFITGVDSGHLITGASNIGTGSGIYSGTIENDLKFKTLIAGPNITLSGDNQHIMISGTAGGAGGGVSWITPSPTHKNYVGTQGQISFDNTYYYICIQTNEWRRVAISEW